MKKVIFTLLAVVSSLLLSAQTVVEKHGLLKVKDAHVVDKDNQFISLCGNSLFWSTNGWEGEKFYNHEVVKFLKEDWNSSIVRIAMGVDGTGNYSTDPTGQTAKVKTVVDACIAEGLYVIIDFHSHYAQNYKSKAITFFKEMATAYGEYDNVIYEIFNEPLNTASWSKTIKPYAEEVIAAIREIDPDNLIIVGTSSWSQKVKEASLDPIDDVNVAYTLHFYADSHKQELRNEAMEAMNNGAAIFITEWGTGNADGGAGREGKDFNEGSSDEWMNFCKENFISACNWAVNDKDETASVLIPGASDTGGWTDEDYTPSGKYIRNLMLNWNKPCESVSVPNTIEAENYCRLYGIQKQICSEGGLHVGDIADENWMSYQITVEKAGDYTVSYRIASPDGGGKIQLGIPGTILGTIDLPETKNWQDWTTVSHNVTLPAGTYDLSVLALTGGFNLNWIKIMPKTDGTPILTDITLYPFPNTQVNVDASIRLSAQGFDQNGNPFPINPAWSIAGNKAGATIDQSGLFTASETIDTYTVTLTQGDFTLSTTIEVIDPCPAKNIFLGKIEAEDFCNAFDMQTEETGDELGGGLNVGYLNNNSSWLTYTIRVPADGTYWIDFRAANGNQAAGRMKILIDNVEILTQNFARTAGWQVYGNTTTIPFELKAGKHELKFNVLAGGFNINWFEFKGENIIQSVNSESTNPIGIYPNPVRQGEFLQLSSPATIHSIRMIDLRGLVVYTKTTDNGKVNDWIIPTGGLTGGVYLLQLTTGQNQAVYKVIIE